MKHKINVALRIILVAMFADILFAIIYSIYLEANGRHETSHWFNVLEVSMVVLAVLSGIVAVINNGLGKSLIEFIKNG